MKNAYGLNRMGSMAAVLLISLCIALFGAPAAYGGMLEDAQFMGRLWSHTQDQKADGNANYLKAVLGVEPFEGKTTGLKDANPYIRGESAKIIAEFSNKDNRGPLVGGVGFGDGLQRTFLNEKDPQAREEMYLACVKLAVDTYSTNKEVTVATYLGYYTQQGNAIYLNPPQIALEFLLQKAMDGGMVQARDPLKNLKNKFAQDEQLSEMIDNALAVINLQHPESGRVGLSGEALYWNAITDDNPVLQAWAVQALTKEKEKDKEVIANSILVKLLTSRDVSAEKRINLFILKQAMEEKMFLRSENPNPSVEELDNNPNGKVKSWWTQQTSLFRTSTEAESYARGLEVNGFAYVSSCNIPVYFTKPYPKKIEYGCSYKMAYMSIVPEPGLTEAQRPKITLSAAILFTDGTRYENNVAVENPYEFNWENADARYESDKPIKAAQLGFTVTGKGHFFFDDLYMRRAESEFTNTPPQISIPSGLNPAVAVAGEFVTLKANVTDREGNMVTGHWASNLEGGLDRWDLNKVEGRGQITSMVKFQEAGEHTLFFTARDEFGYEDIATTTIKVLDNNLLTLTATYVKGGVKTTIVQAQDSIAHPVSGNIELNVVLAPEFKAQLANYTLDGVYVYANDPPQPVVDDLSSESVRQAKLLILDSSRLPEGINNLQAKLFYHKNDLAANSLIAISNEVILYVDTNDGNQSNSKTPRIIAPEDNAAVEKEMEIVVEFDAGAINNLNLADKLYCFNTFLRNKAANTYQMIATTRNNGLTQYKFKYSLTQTKPGDYQLFVLAVYPNGATVSNEWKRAYSRPVNITVLDPSKPVNILVPTNLIVKGWPSYWSQNENEAELSWQDNSDNEQGFRIERSDNGNAGSFIKLADVGRGVTEYTDTNLKAGVNYSYKVRAFMGNRISGYAGPVQQFFRPPAPRAPVNITARATGQGTINGNPVSGPWTDIVVGPGRDSYDDIGLQAGKSYHYRLQSLSLNATGGILDSSELTPAVMATTFPVGVTLAAPSGLTAVQLSPYEFGLYWQNNDANQSELELWRNDVKDTLDSFTGGTVVNFENSGLPAGSYTFKLRARNTVAGNRYYGVSEYSNSVVVVFAPPVAPVVPPSAPSGLTAKVVGRDGNQVELNWTDNSDNETGFTIARSSNPQGPFNYFTSAGSNQIKFVDVTSLPNGSYYYMVRAKKGEAVSAFSNVAGVNVQFKRTLPAAPVGLEFRVEYSPPALIWHPYANDGPIAMGFIVE
ncbi:MAG: fibronectin type III domain-containing protein, partial [Candidatus Omnitrophica bacterium]|nr:fibronectin type III domain-containing protein [Candidatus Omnitrophota bacterium]